MANPEHLEILKQGVEQWNRWRKEHPNVAPDLAGANLSKANLSGAILGLTDFREANLRGTSLFRANLRAADLRRADLRETDCRQADLKVANLAATSLVAADLSGANIRAANLRGAHFSGTNLSGAIASSTIFADIDLSAASGLETIQHDGPSTVGIDTIYKSRGKIPEVFLRGCGVPNEFIAYIGSMGTPQPRRNTSGILP